MLALLHLERLLILACVCFFSLVTQSTSYVIRVRLLIIYVLGSFFENLLHPTEWLFRTEYVCLLGDIGTGKQMLVKMITYLYSSMN